MSNPVSAVAIDFTLLRGRENSMREGFEYSSVVPLIQLGQYFVLIPSGSTALADLNAALRDLNLQEVAVYHPADLQKPEAQRRYIDVLKVGSSREGAVLERLPSTQFIREESEFNAYLQNIQAQLQHKDPGTAPALAA